jgi:hypothetical protein
MLTLALVLCPAVLDTVNSRDPGSWKRTRCGPEDIPTQYADDVNPSDPLPEYPRPQLTRVNIAFGAAWATLNGLYEYGPASSLDAPPPFGVSLPSSILVPFPPESCLSGLGAFNSWPMSTPDFSLSWYRVVFDSPLPSPMAGTSTLLHFGACDWNCSVWLNRKFLGNHIGGYDGFTFDVTAVLGASGNELIVLAFDPTEKGDQPAGKQLTKAILTPAGDKYTPSSGIWQTVWLETAPAVHVAGLKVGNRREVFEEELTLVHQLLCYADYAIADWGHAQCLSFCGGSRTACRRDCVARHYSRSDWHRCCRASLYDPYPFAAAVAPRLPNALPAGSKPH